MLACSGPGAGAAIAGSLEIGRTHALIGGAMAVATAAVYLVGRRGWVFPVGEAALMALHPLWVLGARGGDCGYLLRDAAPVWTAVGAVGLCGQVGYVAWVLVRRSRPDAAGDYEEGPDGAVPDGRAEPRATPDRGESSS